MTLHDQDGLLDNPRPARKAPLEPVRIRIAFDSTEDITNDSANGPIELTIEATNREGEIADWLHDDFWTDVINRLADRSCTIHFQSTPGAVLHPVVLHQVEMLQRVMPNWRTVAHARVDDFATDEEVRQIAASAFSELRIEDGRRSARVDEMASPTRTVDELFGHIRRHQNQMGTAMPVLVRLPSAISKPIAAPTSDRSVPESAHHASQI